jgi:ribonuclease R
MNKSTKKRSRSDNQQQLYGRLSLQRHSCGFVKIQESSRYNKQEVYIHPSRLNGAWNNDLVTVQILRSQHGKNPEGSIVEILERSIKEMAVIILPQKVQATDKTAPPLCLAKALDPLVTGYMLVDVSSLEDPARHIHTGDILLVSLLPREKQKNDGVVRVLALSVLGGYKGQKSLSVYETLVKTEHNIAMHFPPAVLEECALLPENPAPEIIASDKSGQAKRRDLRRLGFVTIDGQDARDFDDAVYVEQNGAVFTLWVAIADVAHYVQIDSALDLEARTRGNSNYFPASVEPMLPETLSNGLCSLKPGLPRFALVAQISFSPDGEPQSREFYPALIQSKARLTYEEVHAALELEEESARLKLAPELPMLERARRLAGILFERRAKQGTLSFDLPETKVILNAQGEIQNLLFSRQLSSHKLIEEFMIAANEAVAGYLAALPERPQFLYRVHPAPEAEKLRDFYRTMAENGLGVNVPQFTSPSLLVALQTILEQARGKPEEFVVNRLLLRSMMQARYTSAAEGHFGLASAAYCHFTSPIRRYADLTVHRVLRRYLGLQHEKKALPANHELMEVAEALNNAERNSIEAERDIHKICAALFLERLYREDPDRVYSAIVAGLSSFGLFVELADMPAEGFLAVEALEADSYRLEAERQMLLGLRTGVIYRLGQSLKLVVQKVDPGRREIRFELAQKPGQLKKIYKPKTGKKNETKNKRARFPAGSVRIRKMADKAME